MNSARALPKVLTESDNFLELSAQEATSFQARIAHIEQLCERAESWVRLSPVERQASEGDTRTFFDNWALYLSIVISPSYEEGRRSSTWLVHSTWTPDGVGKPALTFLSDEILGGLDMPQPATRSGESAFSAWFEAQLATLRALLSAFYDSDDYPATFASLVGIDVTLANLFAGVTKARLTQFWASSARYGSDAR